MNRTSIAGFKLLPLLLIVIAMVLGCFEEPSATKSTSTPTGEYAVLIKSLANPYWKIVYDGLIDTSKDLQIPVYIQGLAAEDQAEAQLNQCENILVRKPKALLFSAVNSYNLLPCLKRADQSGIPLVDLDGNVTEELAKKEGIKVAFSVASNNYELGEKAALYLAGKSGKVLVIEGLPGSEPGELRVKGFKENLSAGLTVVSSLPGDWDRLKAANIVSDTLTQHPDLKYIYAVNDLMALGAVESVSARGIKDLEIVGIDGISDAVKAIESGALSASIAQLPYLIAKEGLEKARKYVAHKEQFAFNQYVPVVTLDREVLASKKDPLLKYVR